MTGTTAGPLRRWFALALTGAVLALAAGGVLVALTFDHSTWETLRRVGPPIAALLAALMTASWCAAAGRILLLTRSLGHHLRYRDSFVVAVSGEFGVVATPTGLGGTALRLALLRARGVPLTTGTAVVGADFILDVGVAVLVTTLAIPLTLLFPGSRDLMERLADEVDPRIGMTAGACLALLVVGALLWRWLAARRGATAVAREPEVVRLAEETLSETEADGAAGRAGAGEDTGSASGGVFSRLRHRLRDSFQRARSGLATLFRHRRPTVAWCFLLAFVQLLCRYSVLPVVVLTLVGPTRVFLLYPLQGLLMLIAHVLVLPGGGGSVELGAGVVLALFLPAPLVGAAVLLWRLFTYHWNLFVGGAVFAFGLAREGGRLSWDDD